MAAKVRVEYMYVTPSPVYYADMIKCRLRPTGSGGTLLNKDLATWSVCLSEQVDMLLIDRRRAWAEVEEIQNSRGESAAGDKGED